MGASYDLSTPTGQTRFRIPDTNVANPIFSDAEIGFLLENNEDNPLLAAAEALETIAGDPERLVQFSRGSVAGTRTTSEDILKRVRSLREKAYGGGILVGKLERTDFW
ncbi:MAG: hypothetical protein QM401_00725 [Bacillota bacterium]|nr:hypothetical protein [Bacillota bacterium]